MIQAAKRGSTSRRNSPDCLPLLDDALQDRERLSNLPDLRLQVLAPRDLTNHDGHERRVVPPGAQEDLRHALELLGRRLVGLLDRAEAHDQLTPVLDEDRAQHLVLRREVVVEQAVRDPASSAMSPTRAPW